MSLVHHYGEEPVVHTHETHGMDAGAMKAMFAKMNSSIATGGAASAAKGGAMTPKSKNKVDLGKAASRVGPSAPALHAPNVTKAPGKALPLPKAKTDIAGRMPSVVKAASGGALTKSSGERANLGAIMKGGEKAPKLAAPTLAKPKAPGGHEKGGAHKGHSPLEAAMHQVTHLEHTGGGAVKTLKEVGAGVAKAAIAGTGQEPIEGALKKQLAGHHFGLTHNY